MAGEQRGLLGVAPEGADDDQMYPRGGRRALHAIERERSVGPHRLSLAVGERPLVLAVAAHGGEGLTGGRDELGVGARPDPHRDAPFGAGSHRNAGRAANRHALRAAAGAKRLAKRREHGAQREQDGHRTKQEDRRLTALGPRAHPGALARHRAASSASGRASAARAPWQASASCAANRASATSIEPAGQSMPPRSSTRFTTTSTLRPARASEPATAAAIDGSASAAATSTTWSARPSPSAGGDEAATSSTSGHGRSAAARATGSPTGMRQSRPAGRTPAHPSPVSSL